MSSLPQGLDLKPMQTRWASQLDPIISSPIVQGQIVHATLINGTTVINHGLGRKLQGWFIIGINAAATVYDNQSTNQMPNLTLSLTSNAAANVAIWVF